MVQIVALPDAFHPPQGDHKGLYGWVFYESPCAASSDASGRVGAGAVCIDSNKIEKLIPHPAFLADGRGPGAHLR
jgi:hypothetical protein